MGPASATATRTSTTTCRLRSSAAKRQASRAGATSATRRAPRSPTCTSRSWRSWEFRWRNWVIAPARSTSSTCSRPFRGARRDAGSDPRRRVSLSILAVSVVVAGASIGLAQTRQYPIFTVDHLNSAMKTVGLALDLTKRSIEKNDQELAKDYLVRARDQLATTITF